MLTAVDFIRAQLKRMHAGFDKSLSDLTPEQLHAVPGGHATANTIGWGIWHYVRTEDNIVRWVIQNRRPPIWMEGGYADKRMPATAQGTGMSTADAHALRINDVPLPRARRQGVGGHRGALRFGLARSLRHRRDGEAARRHVGRAVPRPGRAHPRHDPPGRDRAGAHARRSEAARRLAGRALRLAHPRAFAVGGRRLRGHRRSARRGVPGRGRRLRRRLAHRAQLHRRGRLLRSHPLRERARRAHLARAHRLRGDPALPCAIPSGFACSSPCSTT